MSTETNQNPRVHSGSIKPNKLLDTKLKLVRQGCGTGYVVGMEGHEFEIHRVCNLLFNHGVIEGDPVFTADGFAYVWCKRENFVKGVARVEMLLADVPHTFEIHLRAAWAYWESMPVETFRDGFTWDRTDDAFRHDYSLARRANKATQPKQQKHAQVRH